MPGPLAIDDYSGVGTIARSCRRPQKNLEPFLPAVDSTKKGMKLEVFRADPPRACGLVVVLCDGSCGGCFRARISPRRYREPGSSDPPGTALRRAVGLRQCQAGPLARRGRRP